MSVHCFVTLLGLFKYWGVPWWLFCDSAILQGSGPLLYILKTVSFRADVSEDGMKALVTLSSGDMRRALNILQVQSYVWLQLAAPQRQSPHL